MSKKPKKQMVGTRDSETGSIVGKYIEALERIADPRNTHFAGDAQVVARAALAAAPEAPAQESTHVYEDVPSQRPVGDRSAPVQQPQEAQTVPQHDAVSPNEAAYSTGTDAGETDALVGRAVQPGPAVLSAHEAPAQADPMEKLTRIQEELGLYGDKPAQAEQAAQPVRDERAAFEAWANDYALTAEPNYSQATKADCWAAFRAGAALASTERQPSVPPQWREAVKAPNAIEAAAKMLCARMDYPWDYMPEKGREEMRKNAAAILDAAIALADSLEGGE